METQQRVVTRAHWKDCYWGSLAVSKVLPLKLLYEFCDTAAFKISEPEGLGNIKVRLYGHNKGRC